MKRNLLILALAVLTVGLLGSCAKINERIDALDNRVGNVEQEKLSSIDKQVAAINSSIADLGTIRTDIKELQDAIGAKGGDISELKAADEALGQRIDELKDYVGDLSRYAEEDWVKATFATLEQLNATNTVLSALEEKIVKLGETIDTKISGLKTELTNSIDSAISGINATISTLEGRISALEQMIQTVTIVPAYSDGSVKAEDGILTIDCIISPKEAVLSLKKENFAILTSKALTKSVSVDTIKIAKDEDFVIDKTKGTATVMVDVSSALPSEEGKALTVALNVKNGISDFTTEFVKVTNEVVYNKVTKIADYLYEYTAEGYSTEAPSELLFDDGPVPIFGCSAVRNGNFYGRNLDFNINEICEFVVRTKATETRPHASIGVANTCFLNITNDMVKAGLSDKLLKYIPWMMMDGINDAGLVCNINVVNAADIKEHPHTHTNEGAPQIMVMQLVRALLDNCGSVAQAKTYIESHDIREIPTTWDGHIMIADPNETVIVEFTGEKGKEVKYVVQEQMIMTNFYNHLFKEENFLRDRSINNFPAHACGMERYFILSDNYATANSMQGMWELLRKVRYTQSYDTSVDPFWCSEYYDTPKIPTFDDHPMSYWTKEKVLAEEEPAKEVAAYEKYAATGEYKEEDGLWFTTHNSTYDIANKALWVTIREKYESIYKFELK